MLPTSATLPAGVNKLSERQRADAGEAVAGHPSDSDPAGRPDVTV